jgi:hypothetical protein
MGLPVIGVGSKPGGTGGWLFHDTGWGTVGGAINGAGAVGGGCTG